MLRSFVVTGSAVSPTSLCATQTVRAARLRQRPQPWRRPQAPQAPPAPPSRRTHLLATTERGDTRYRMLGLLRVLAPLSTHLTLGARLLSTLPPPGPSTAWNIRTQVAPLHTMAALLVGRARRS